MDRVKSYRFFAVITLFVMLGVLGALIYYRAVDVMTALIIAFPSMSSGYFFGAVMELNKKAGKK